MKIGKNKKVYVAMSGGVDSSVAAALLKKQGHDVTGVFFKPWLPNTKIAYCNWQEDRRDAMRVASKLGIEFKTWDFSKEYGKHVAKYMIEGYRAGITPNPDIMCNKEIKFGLFLKKALLEGADYIATGHYVRKSKNGYKLLKGLDKNKDQSYFLWTLTQEQLKHSLFPVGDYTKPTVRKLAKKFGLPNHSKKDSQGVCFVGQLDMKEFLKKYIKSKKGQIRLIGTEKIIGFHEGASYYTVGQRHGLNIKDGKGPYFVVGKDIKRNIIYVTDHLDSKYLTVDSASITELNWIGKAPKLPGEAFVKIRYRTEVIPTIISKSGKGLKIKFKKNARAVTPGQSAVLYKGQEVLGGGIISDR